MQKPTLNEDQFIAKMNEMLKQQTWYTWDMTVISAPKGSAGITASGYDVTGDVQGWQIANLEKIVRSEYELQVTKFKAK